MALAVEYVLIAAAARDGERNHGEKRAASHRAGRYPLPAAEN
jgi:hypothetical protein